MINILTIPWLFYIRKGLGALLIAAGLAALVTPFTPGAWLIPVGIAILIGKTRVFSWSKKLLGPRWHARLRIERLLHAILKDKETK